ncbi:MAG TPA: hypothetical protein VMV07_15140, partial [Streptosporangiaceae bacterium]|nr:hypothetical protein [Streptosporangiaceae bacterium]
YLAHEVPGVTVPDETLRTMEKAGPSGAQAGLELATELARQARAVAGGVVIRLPDDPAASSRLLAAALGPHEPPPRA